MDLEYRGLEPFEPTLRGLIETAFMPPWPYPRSAFLMLKWAPSDQRRRFISESFGAYHALQRAVAGEVVRMERYARALDGAMMASRRARDRAAEAESQAKIGTIRRRQFVLRRTLDAIVHVACDQYTFFIRRLSIEDHVRPINPDDVARVVDEASRLSEQDPYTLYIVSDLTTSVQVGDLLELSVDPSLERWRIRLVELKGGKISRILLDRLASGTLPGDLPSIRETMGQKSADQAARILRQEQRMQRISEFVHTGRTVDPRTGMEILRTPDRPPTLGYQSELRRLIDAAATHGQAHFTLDGCLTVAAIRADILGDGPHLEESLVHSLFHLHHPSRPCLLPTEHGQAEIDALREEPSVVDLVEQTCHVGWAAPVFSWGTLDRVCDLLMGRVRVFARFDEAAFMERAARLGIKMTWTTRGQVEKLLRKKGRTPRLGGDPKARVVSVELPDGRHLYMLAGCRPQVLLELAKPDTTLKYLLTLGGDLDEMKAAVERADEIALRLRGPGYAVQLVE